MENNETVDMFIIKSEPLENQYIQLGKSIEEFELKMYILRGFRSEYDPNVQILETQRT